MDQQRYDIYFTGKIADGVSAELAQENLAKLFNTTADKVSRLFNGKPQLLKRGMDKATTIKYKTAFEGAGLLVAFKKLPRVTEAKAETEAISLAVTGSDLLLEHERKKSIEANIDTSNIKLVSAFMAVDPEEKPIIPAPDTGHISIAEVGADLLTEKPQPAPPPALDLDDLSLAPPGTAFETITDKQTVVDPDTSGISIAEVGADILPDKQDKPVTDTPDTTHLSLLNND